MTHGPLDSSYAHARQGLTPKASELTLGIEVTRRCNLRCPHCFTASGADISGDPSTEQLLQLLTELAQTGVRSLAFTGGEPLLRQDVPQLVRHAHQAGVLDLGLVTNGYHATAARVQQLRDAGLRTVQVSIDGVDAIDHAAVRACGPGDFYRALRAVRLFVDAGLNVYVATIVCPRNVQRVGEMALFCEALGVRGLRYCTFVPTGRAVDTQVAQAFTVQPEKLDAFLDLIRRLNRQPNAQLRISVDHSLGPWLPGGAFRCESGRRVCYIAVTGDLYPCPALIFDRLRVGNVYRSAVSELLESPNLSAVHCLPRKQIEGLCATCSNEHCTGGCRGLAYALTGRLHGPVPYCNFRRTELSE